MATIRERLDSLLDETDAVFADAFREFMDQVQSDAVMGQVVAALEANDVEAALDIVRRHVVVMGNTSFPTAFQIAGREAVLEVLDQLGPPSVAIAFDPTNPRAAEIMRQETLGLIREFTARQIETTREALAQAFMDGVGTAERARSFRDSIGLTRQMWRAVANYRRLLESQSAQALDRALRDRRFDRSVRRASSGGKPLTRDQINRMVDRYRQRYIAHRADMIARTESGRATSLAREESFRQIAEQTGLGDRLVRIWNSTADKRTRDAHVTMNGQERRMNENFIDGDGNPLRFPHDPLAPPETTINCRCVLTMRITPPR